MAHIFSLIKMIQNYNEDIPLLCPIILYLL
uniref:Uncharacterized protein n=1 Tax=Anguilla anguilla TaxID=7936 RepID=A0A0E9VYN6_ANGAN